MTYYMFCWVWCHLGISSKTNNNYDTITWRLAFTLPRTQHSSMEKREDRGDRDPSQIFPVHALHRHSGKTHSVFCNRNMLWMTVKEKNNGNTSSYNSAKSLPDVGFTKVIMDWGIISKNFFVAMAWGQGNKPSEAGEDSLYLRLFVLTVNTVQNRTYQSVPSRVSPKSLLTAPKENQLLQEMKRLELNLPLPKVHCVTL